MSIHIKAEKRLKTGKNAARQIRREGKVPVILYGPKTSDACLIMDKKDLFRVLKAGENTIFQVSCDSKKWNVMIKELQLDPVNDELCHVDLVQVAMDKLIRVFVPLHHVGEPVGVKSEGGMADWLTREVEIECLPKNIPEAITIDVGGLHINQSLKVEDIVPPEGVRIVSDPEAVVVVIEMPSAEEEIVEEEEEEEIIGEEAEPEVIKKEKEATEEGEEEE